MLQNFVFWLSRTYANYWADNELHKIQYQSYIKQEPKTKRRRALNTLRCTGTLKGRTMLPAGVWTFLKGYPSVLEFRETHSGLESGIRQRFAPPPLLFNSDLEDLANVVKQGKEMRHKSERKIRHYHSLQMLLENPRESAKIH